VLSNNDNNGLSRSDGKRPDGLTLVPWKEGKPLTWDSTVVCTVADSYVSGSAREAGTAAKPAAQRKEAKYATLQGTHLFQPVAVESMGTVEEATSSFLAELGHRISALSGDSREITFLFQRVSVDWLGLQRFKLTLFCCVRVLLQTAAQRMTYRVIRLP